MQFTDVWGGHAFFFSGVSSLKGIRLEARSSDLRLSVEVGSFKGGSALRILPGSFGSALLWLWLMGIIWESSSHGSADKARDSLLVTGFFFQRTTTPKRGVLPIAHRLSTKVPFWEPMFEHPFDLLWSHSLASSRNSKF